jgi:hypothetical protein
VAGGDGGAAGEGARGRVALAARPVLDVAVRRAGAVDVQRHAEAIA